MSQTPPDNSERFEAVLKEINTDSEEKTEVLSYELLAARKFLGVTIGGRFKVTDIIGHGAMGFVYKATHTHLGHDCAIKILNPTASKSPERIARFKREAQASIALGHPNIINVTDLDFLENGRPFIVMEYYQGQDLRTLLKETGPLSLGYVLKYLRETALALDFAHQIGIVHRDIKPENLFLLDQKGPSPAHIKLLDFGIASLKQFYHLRNTQSGYPQENERQLTTEGQTPGTIAYMAPEVAMEEDPDHRSDIYSLAVVVYELLTTNFPIHGNNIYHFAMSKCHEKPASLTKNLYFKAPDAIEAVLAKGLARHAKDRYGSAGVFAVAFAEAVQQSLPHLPEKLKDEHLEAELEATLHIPTLSTEQAAKIAEETRTPTAEKLEPEPRRKRKTQQPNTSVPPQNGSFTKENLEPPAVSVEPQQSVAPQQPVEPQPPIEQTTPSQNSETNKETRAGFETTQLQKSLFPQNKATFAVLTAACIAVLGYLGWTTYAPTHSKTPTAIPAKTTSNAEPTSKEPIKQKPILQEPATPHQPATPQQTPKQPQQKLQKLFFEKKQTPPSTVKNPPTQKKPVQGKENSPQNPETSISKTTKPSNKKATAEKPQNTSAKDLVRQGGQALRSRDHKKASSLLRQATSLDPNDKQAWYLLGKSYELGQNLKNARRAYQRYLQLDPNSPTARQIKNKLERM